MKLKKYSLIFLIVLAVTIAVFAIPTFAATGNVIYVKDGGTGNGASPDAPMGDLFAAIDALPADGGTVIVCGDLTISAYPTGKRMLDSKSGCSFL